MASALERQDPAVYAAVVGEERRLREHIQLIPSENYPVRPCWKRTGR